MLVELHLCGPEGDVRRQQLTRLLNELKRDNVYVINAMLNAGQHVADTVIELGLDYDPAQGREKASERQPFYGMRKMVELRTFRCGDASAYEAAVLESKYGVPTQVLVVPQGSAEFHGIYVTPEGPVDPTENWLRYWEARTHPQGVSRPPVDPVKGREPVEPVSMCHIDGGKVQCTDEDDASACCVDPRGRWNCPDHHPLHGSSADVQARRSKDGQRWALVGPNKIPVPLCPPRRSA